MSWIFEQKCRILIRSKIVESWDTELSYFIGLGSVRYHPTLHPVVFYSSLSYFIRFCKFSDFSKNDSQRGHTTTYAVRKYASYEQLISPDKRKKWRLSPSPCIQEWCRILFIMNKIGQISLRFQIKSYIFRNPSCNFL